MAKMTPNSKYFVQICSQLKFDLYIYKKLLKMKRQNYINGNLATMNLYLAQFILILNCQLATFIYINTTYLPLQPNIYSLALKLGLLVKCQPSIFFFSQQVYQMLMLDSLAYNARKAFDSVCWRMHGPVVYLHAVEVGMQTFTSFSRYISRDIPYILKKSTYCIVLQKMKFWCY